MYYVNYTIYVRYYQKIDWEQRKLGEVAEIIGGGTPNTKNPEYWGGNIDWYSPIEIGNSIYVKASKKRITDLGLEKSSAKLLPVGTVLYTSRAGIGNTAILAKEGTTNQGFQSIIPKSNLLDTYFIYSRTDELKRYGERTGAGSTFIEVSGKQMAKMNLYLPLIEEQKQISNFFKTLDILITLHQRKLDLLMKLKEAYLQQMFPEKGKAIPRVRFANFNELWGQYKLNEIGERYNGLSGKTKSDFGHGDAEYITYLNVFRNPIANENETERIEIDDTQNQVQFGDVFFTTSSETPEEVGLSSVWTGRQSNVYLNSFCFGYRPKQKIDSYFLAYMLRAPSFRRKMTYLAQGISRYNISKRQVMNIDVFIPPLGEQIKIGKFINSINNNIIKQQYKLDALKELKKGYMQQMIV